VKLIVRGVILPLVLCALAVVFTTNDAEATAAFARKYGVACEECHTTFPRLTWEGEKFMRNGFRFSGEEEEGEAVKQSISDRISLGKIGNFLSIGGKINAWSKEEERPSAVGSTQHGSIFAGGTMAKDISYWMEMETSTGTGETEINNYFVGFHNIGNITCNNLRIGSFTPTEWTSFSSQKRALTMPQVYNLSVGGTADTIGFGSETGIEYYGYHHAFLWAVGLTNGGNQRDVSADSNNWKNWYGVLRADLEEGPLEGSSVSVLYYRGRDFVGATTASDGSPNDEDDYTKVAYSTNVRIAGLDLQGVFYQDRDIRNATGGTDRHQGYSIQAVYPFLEHYYGILKFDRVESDDDPSSEYKHFTAAVDWEVRENCKVTFLYDFDKDPESNGASPVLTQENTAEVSIEFNF